jgi:hypothetical protein
MKPGGHFLIDMKQASITHIASFLKYGPAISEVHEVRSLLKASTGNLL